MKYLKSNLTSVAVFVLCVLLLFVGCHSEKNQISFGESVSWREFLNFHESPVNWLAISGKKFTYVRGARPYYINVPGRDLVFFVTTDRAEKNFIYHFVSLNGGAEIAIPTKYTYLGRGIGMSPDSYVYDWVEKIEGSKIFIAGRLYKEVARYEFDLDKAIVVEHLGFRDEKD